MSTYTPIIAREAKQFSGTEHSYQHPYGIVFTDGVKWLRETLQCYWLIDDIALFSRKFWEKETFMTVHYGRNKKSAVLEFTDGNDNLLLSHYYDFSDLKIDNEAFVETEEEPFLSLFLIYDGHFKKPVLILPSEY